MAVMDNHALIKAEVVSDPSVMSGDPVVKGTRVPAKTVLAYLRGGHTSQSIFEDYPSLPIDGIDAVMTWAETMYGPGWKAKHPSEGVIPLIDRLLIDECLSAGLVAIAKARGFDADHVTYLGKTGWQDWDLMQFALKNDYVIVTNNRRDFLKLYAKTDFHNGLVIIIPEAKRMEQIRLFDKALDVMSDRNDHLTNKLVEILADGSLHIRDWTLHDHNTGHIGDPKWPRQ